MPEAADIETINDSIVENATKPSSVSFGQRSVQQRSLKDQVEAAQHIASQVASSKGHFGLRFTKLIPPEGG